MNEVRLNILDAQGAVNGTVHCGLAEAAIAALSAEPETIAELEVAIERFIKRRDGDQGAFHSFKSGEDLSSWDQGVVIIDLAARIIATKSLYCIIKWRGDVKYYEEDRATDIALPYCIPEDWQIIHSVEDGIEVCDAVAQYLSDREERRTQRAANPPIDIREILYGREMIRFIVDACVTAKNRGAVESFHEPDAGDLQENVSPSVTRLMRVIHGRWLMTPRAGLRGKTPREVILDNLFFIDSENFTREFQWERLGEAPPPIARDSHTYRFAGFGIHEFIVYYHMFRHLLSACLTRLTSNVDTPSEDSPLTSNDAVEQSSPDASLIEWLESVREMWLNQPNELFEERIPNAIIETERRRIPMQMTEDEIIREEEIPEEDIDRVITKIKIAKSEIREETTSYRWMDDEIEGEGLAPDLKYLDTPEDEEDFIFSTYRTREEWQAARDKGEDLNERYEQIRGRDEDDGDTRVH